MPEKPKRIRQRRILLLHVQIDGTDPLIWRRLAIRDDTTLHLLHAVIQIAMGWNNMHPHIYYIQGFEYSDPELDLNLDRLETKDWVLDECEVSLKSLHLKQGDRFKYLYDFGDSWRHTITVEKIVPADEKVKRRAWCIDGARKCPPEDCGGLTGFGVFLDAMADPDRKKHHLLKKWHGRLFDPGKFEADFVNTYLKKLRWVNPYEDELDGVLKKRNEGERRAEKHAKGRTTKELKGGEVVVGEN